MPLHSRSIHLTTLLLSGLSIAPVLAQGTVAPTPTPAPTEAPEETVINVVERRTIDAQHLGNSETLVPETTIERNPAKPTLNNIIADTVPGAAALPNGAIRIRGSDNQFSYYLDGAPLPANVSAFITDQFNPKNIESLRVTAGAYPARYGGQLSAIFDIKTKSGRAGEPEGFVQGEFGNFGTRNGAVQYSNGVGKLGYFLSAFRAQSDFRLSPISPEPFHNAGAENVGFGKFDYQLSQRDLLTFHVGAQNARLEVPNSPDREEVGQDNYQLEKKGYFNAIWRRNEATRDWTLSLYSHSAQNRYLGSAADLIPSDEDDDDEEEDDDDDDDDTLISVNQRQKIRYTGLRGDFSTQSGKNRRLGAGFEYRHASGDLNFSLVSAPEAGFDPLIDNRRLSGSDLGFYVQDEWQLGKFNVNYGARYDQHRTRDNGNYSQLSPRLNLAYEASKSDSFYAYYNRLWMPVPIESIRRFEGNSAIGDLTLSRVRPESDDLYGIGWKKKAGKNTFTVDAYYKGIKNIIDNQEIGDTLLEVPINEARGIIRGIEFSYDRPITKRLSFNGSYGLSRGIAAGPVVGGLFGLEGLPPGFFVDDHDITHIASLSLNYTGKRTYALLNGQFESGLPFGEIEDEDGNPTRINFKRVPSHFVLNAGVGHQFKNGLEVALNVNNLLDKEYIIQGDNLFRRSLYGQRRSVSLKTTWNF